MKHLVVLLCIVISVFSKAQVISTVAGNGTSGYSGDGSLATNAQLSQPGELFFDKVGSLYMLVWDNMFRKVDTNGIITTILGDGGTGFSPDGTVATAAQFDGLVPGSFDAHGNLIFGDPNNHRIRKMDAITGIITTIAGTGTPGYSVDSGLATTADLYYPGYPLVDEIGNIFFIDLLNYRIRKVDTNGFITTFAGTGVSSYSGDGGPATAATFSDLGGGLAFDVNWNLYVADRTQNKIRVIDRETRIIRHYAGSGSSTYITDGIPATGAGFTIHGIVGDAYGNIYFSGNTDQRVFKIDNSGIFHWVAGTGIAGFNGDGINATAAQLNTPYDVTVDKCGNLFIADGNNQRVRKVTYPPPTPTVTIASLPTDTLCAELAANIHATVLATGTNTYQWFVNGSVVSATSSALSYLAANGDSVRCVVTNISPCTGTHVISSNTIHLVVDSTSIPTIALSGALYAATGSTVTVNASVAGAGSSYQIKWRNRGVWFATTTVPIVTYTKTNPIDTITAWVVHTGTGCYDSTLSGVHVVIDSTLGIFSSNSPASFTLYPNPATNELSIKAQEDIRQITVTNLLGKTVLSEAGNSNEKNLQLAGLPAGVYFVTVNGIWRSKFVKE